MVCCLAFPWHSLGSLWPSCLACKYNSPTPCNLGAKASCPPLYLATGRQASNDNDACKIASCILLHAVSFRKNDAGA